LPQRTLLKLVKEEDRGVFGPEDIATMTTAFDRLLADLKLIDPNDPVVTMLAKLVIEIVRNGERDPEQVRKQVLKRCDMLEKTPSGESATTSPRAKRSVRRRAPARAAATPEESSSLFNYSEEEWLAIETAIQAVRKGTLPKKIRKWLVGEARWYLADRIHPNERREWEKAAFHVEKARQLISGIAERLLELFNKAGYAEKIGQAVVNRVFGEDLGDLTRIRDEAKETAELNKKGPINGAHFDNMKFMYVFKVLLIWTSLGGELKVSRHPRHGNIQGPLARFFRAVTVPVMGPSAPSPESLPEILRRQRKFLAFEATPQGRLLLRYELAAREDHLQG
jgi:hypothetical protein